MRKIILIISFMAILGLYGCSNTTELKIQHKNVSVIDTVRGSTRPGSTITFKSSNSKKETTANDDGKFSETDLTPGTYTVTADYYGTTSSPIKLHVKNDFSEDRSEDNSYWSSTMKEDTDDSSTSSSANSESSTDTSVTSSTDSASDSSTSSTGISDIAIEDTIKQNVSDVKVKEVSGEYHKPVTTGIDINVKDSSDYYDEGAYKKDAYHILLAIKDDYGFSDFKNIAITFYMDGDALVKSSFDQSALKQINHKDSNYYNIDSVATEWNADNLNAKYNQ
ncbi:carboxypeptidase-like regulatory domain-containing protein [Lactiplantibacillus plantarum]|uniref:carboxypeptidase-like regulatory domain-containing protein n=1 Tax=Lactiplantibacillus plantarum TaxID=1590 RepID=UPI003B50CBFE